MLSKKLTYLSFDRKSTQKTTQKMDKTQNEELPRASLDKGKTPLNSRSSQEQISPLFFNPGLSLKSYALINKIWQSHVLNRKKEFMKATTILIEYMSKE